MSLTLTVDGDRWRSHLRAVADATPGLVPVAKGNGYGFTLGRLARRAAWLGVDTLAVGTYEELPEVASRFDGSLLVLSPWRPHGAALDLDERLARRVVHTLGRLADLDALLARQPDARLVLERITSMRRHGFTAGDLRTAVDRLRHGPARVEGVALHLPLHPGTTGGSHLPEVRRLMGDIQVAGAAAGTVWVSHLTAPELTELSAAYADVRFRPRVGTGLWLGDPAALRATATVLDVHPIERGDVFGYRGRTAPRAGHLVVVSGGTAHGIGLDVPTGDRSVRARAAALARGGLGAAGVVRSPFRIAGKQRLFAEPPHMQASMVFLPSGARVPEVGEKVDVRVRYTATAFDGVVIS